MFYKYTPLLLFISLIFCIGCKPDEPDDEMFVQVVDEEFMVHLESFIYEGGIRGQDIDLQNYNFEIIFGNLDSLQARGWCREIGSQSDFEIVIDREEWGGMDFVQQENLIYHELGHCYLGRPHLTNLIELGNVCTSIMSPGGFCFRDLYDERWRSYYLDELFNEGAPEPEWNRNSVEDPIVVGQVLLDIQDTTLQSYVQSTIDVTNFDGYELEVSFSEQTRRISMYLNEYLVHLDINNSQSFYVMDTTGITFPLQNDFRFPSGFVSSQAVGFSNDLYYFAQSVFRNNINPDFSISIRIRIDGESLYFYVNEKQLFVRKNNLGSQLNFEVPMMLNEEEVSISIVELDI